MTLIHVDIYGNEGEITSLIDDASGSAEFIFNEKPDAFLVFSAVSAPIHDGKCRLDISSIPDGEYTPRVITESESIPLTPVIKAQKHLRVASCDDTYIRALSQKLRALEKRSAAAEERIEELYKKVYGTSLF